MSPIRRHSSNHPRLLLAAAVLVLTSPPLAEAPGQGAKFTHTTPGPTSSGSAANDLRTTLSFEPLPNYGYQPATLLVDAVKPAASDRQITVRLYVDRGFNDSTSRYDQAVEQDAELPAGAKSLNIEMLVPKLHDWGMIRWEVWVDGRLDPDLMGWAPQQTPSAEGQIDLLMPGALPQDYLLDLTNLLAGRWPRGQPNSGVEVATDPLPQDWRALEPYHAVVMPLAGLREQAEVNPAGVAALRRWVALGGRLLIENVGSDFRRLNEVDDLLRQQAQPFDRVLAQAQQAEVQVAEKEEEDVTEEVPEPPFAESPTWLWAQVQLPRGPNPFDAASADAPADAPGEGRGRSESADGWFLESPLGFGVVGAFPASLWEVPGDFTGGEVAERFEGIERRWLQRAVLRHLASGDWTERHGLAPDRGNEEFSNWLVPGVGAAPVDAFRLLITLFVVLVGPASFFVLRAYHRTQLLALTAPLAAAAFTLCLFAYATLSDGVGLRVRARSLTFLDQERGEAVSWSRQSYYAGLAPADGLAFPADAAVYPILAAWDAAEINAEKPFQRELLVEPDAERYSKGWLASRQTSQLLVLDGRATDARLVFGGSSEQPTVVNKLGAEIDRLFVLDHDANWWTAQAVPADAPRPLTPSDRAGVVAAARKAFLDAAPAYPPGIDSSTPRTARDLLGRRRSRDRLGRLSGASLVDGRLERVLSQVEGRGDGLTTPLKPGSYIAITSRAACAPLGHPDARELGAFHVTLGAWEIDNP